MKILFYLGHPAHFHFYRPIFDSLSSHGHKIKIIIKSKDILQEILEKEGYKFHNISKKGEKNSKLEIILNIISRDFSLFWIVLKYKPDLMIGSIPDITHIGKLLGIPSIVPLEDDLFAVPQFDKITSPWASSLVAPECCDVYKWDYKTIKYNGYQELTYLSPKYFQPDRLMLKNIFDDNNKNFIIRFSSLAAYHDEGKSGITKEIAQRIINILESHGNIYITSEKKLDSQFEKYRIQINPIDMHHALYFADMYIGDSQTMTAEAAVLGTPALRFNDFVGKLGYLEELEHKYGLTYGIKTSEPEKLYDKIKELLVIPNLKEEWQKRRKKMLEDKIDVTSFMVWFIENYPKSVHIMKSNPNYQYKFR